MYGAEWRHKWQAWTDKYPDFQGFLDRCLAGMSAGDGNNDPHWEALADLGWGYLVPLDAMSTAWPVTWPQCQAKYPDLRKFLETCIRSFPNGRTRTDA